MLDFTGISINNKTTQINKIAGLQITKALLGHQSIKNTDHYAHLNPDIYASHMKQHPYMNFDLEDYHE